MRALLLIPLTLVALVLLAGCNPGVRFTTELSVTEGLRRGDPVTHEGVDIGKVAAIKSQADGKSAVEIAIDSNHTADVRNDSILVLRAAGGPPHLELINPNPGSPPAAPGSAIAGAATEAEQALMMSRGQLKGLAADLSEMLQKLNTNLEGLSNSPAWNQLQQDLKDVQAQLAAAGSQGREILDKQLPRLQGEVAKLEQQLLAQGKTEQARRLRRQLDELASELAMPKPSPTPNVD